MDDVANKAPYFFVASCEFNGKIPPWVPLPPERPAFEHAVGEMYSLSRALAEQNIALDVPKEIPGLLRSYGDIPMTEEMEFELDQARNLKVIHKFAYKLRYFDFDIPELYEFNKSMIKPDLPKIDLVKSSEIVASPCTGVEALEMSDSEIIMNDLVKVIVPLTDETVITGIGVQSNESTAENVYVEPNIALSDDAGTLSCDVVLDQVLVDPDGNAGINLKVIGDYVANIFRVNLVEEVLDQLGKKCWLTFGMKPISSGLLSDYGVLDGAVLRSHGVMMGGSSEDEYVDTSWRMFMYDEKDYISHDFMYDKVSDFINEANFKSCLRKIQFSSEKEPQEIIRLYRVNLLFAFNYGFDMDYVITEWRPGVPFISFLHKDGVLIICVGSKSYGFKPPTLRQLALLDD